MQREGHDVSAIVAEEHYAEALKGLVRVMPGSEVYKASEYDLVVMDTSGMGEDADAAREQVPTIGGSVLADKLEEDRIFSLEFMQRCGLQVSPWEAFDNPADAIRFIKKRNTRLVFKPIGEQSDKSTTYVSRSAEDMLDYFDVLFRTAKVKEFILVQEYVAGPEVSDGSVCHQRNGLLRAQRHAGNKKTNERRARAEYGLLRFVVLDGGARKRAVSKGPEKMHRTATRTGLRWPLGFEYSL